MLSLIGRIIHCVPGSFDLICCEVGYECCVGTTEAYQMPFDGIVSNNPKVEEMRQVVSVEKKRPAIPSKWHSDEVLIVHML